ncbi:hypothetical protein EDM52_03560 [Brevibacillus invocatus]|uniref:Uncharacterized protein n=1 Tax=Brevibacillus invocatus TaxID=173959 RepID=A0A3M8CMA0_9BACL|nr:hypothetical protein EDM52_03560 [Brevibacillus invocatus]
MVQKENEPFQRVPDHGSDRAVISSAFFYTSKSRLINLNLQKEPRSFLGIEVFTWLHRGFYFDR